MKVLMLSWEYPPKSVGGLSNHVYFLSQSLKNLGHEIHVITCSDSKPSEEEDGVFVHRILPYNLKTEDFTKWVMHLNFSMLEEAIKLINTNGKFDIIHAHDWLSAYSAKVLKGAYNIPIICTIHSTEYGRNGGIRTDMQRYISSAEWMLTYEAWKVIVCSDYMKDEIKNVFNTPLDKISVVPNGVNVNEFNIDFDNLEFRRKYAADEEKIVLYVGRHVYEKGIQLLIEAAPDILNSYRKLKFVIVGDGAMTEELRQKVKYLGLENEVIFTGHLDETSKNKLYEVSDLSVVPSIYEPFGIVALESMAAGCPVVVSDVGGLKEVVEHKVNGMKFVPGSKDSLKDNVLELLLNENLRDNLRKGGFETASTKYTWEKIALDTTAVYEKVKEEAKGTEWEVIETKPKKKRIGTVKKKKLLSEEKEEIKTEAQNKGTKTKRTRKKIGV